MKKNSTIYVYILSVLLVIALIFIYVNNRKSKEIQKHLRESFSVQLSELYDRYDEVSSDNEELNEKLNAAKDSISKMQKSITKLNFSLSTLNEYKKKVSEMKVQQRELIEVADSLRRMNEILIMQRNEAENALSLQTKLSEELSDRNKKLRRNVDRASLLEIVDVVVEGVSVSSDGEVSVNNRARSADKIRACFTVLKNKLSKKGDRQFFVRVLSPENNLVTNLKHDNEFTAEDNLMKYSGKIDILYENENLDVCVYVDKLDAFEKGIYRVFIYTENRLLKETELMLK